MLNPSACARPHKFPGSRIARSTSPLILLVAAAASLSLGSTASLAQEAEAPQSAEERVRVAASSRYEAGRVHRFVLGGGYRDLWESEIELPVLDLAREGGGLTPTGRFGGLQTAVIGFKGEDGRAYSFRGTDKDPSAVLDSLLQDTIVQVIVQDQMAAQHPGGPPSAGVLTEAAGVLTVQEQIVVMPDDPRLGKYREEFAGMVGTFFVYPQKAKADRAGFAEATEILDHEELYAALENDDATVVDVQAFLQARLMDLLLGDFDRHRKQWRWAAIPGEAGLQPIPEDRDQAFVRYDGVGQRVMKIYIPILQEYGPDYPFVKGLTLHGWEQDRWLLTQLSWPTWEATAKQIVESLDESVIERAVAKLPPEYAALDGARLAEDIRGRRDNLLEVTRRFYAHLAGQVDIQLSNAAQNVEIEHLSGGRMRVSAKAKDEGDADGRLLFDRVFEPSETKEVRLYLRDGNDRVRVSGGRSPITLRVIAGTGLGSKEVDDRDGGTTKIYDAAGNVNVLAGSRTRVIEKAYSPPPSDAGFVDVEGVPPRDWGSDTIPLPEFGFEPDVGVFLGVAASHTRYGFRKDPWSSKHSLGVGYAFEANAPRVRYLGQFRPENSDLLGSLEIGYSGIEVLRFFGFGNETNDNGDSDDREFRVRNQRFRTAANLTRSFLDDRIRLVGGTVFEIYRTQNGSRLIDDLNPYGADNDFTLLGAQANFRYDTRKSVGTTKMNLELPFGDKPVDGYPTSGFLFDVTGRIQPPIFDVDDTYGSIKGSISGYLSFGQGDRVTLALRAGGEETFGRTPYFDVAFVGGGGFFSGETSIRGFRTRRFAGDSSVFGNADLRVVLGRFKLIVPGDVGVHGFFDVGRVFINDESSDNWHPSGGAGVWFSPLVRTNTISLSVANSSEETLAYLRFGFHY
ncbi:MAG: hypothetical protein AB8G23_17915 [Myxococcota bacterium]